MRVLSASTYKHLNVTMTIITTRIKNTKTLIGKAIASAKELTLFGGIVEVMVYAVVVGM